MTQEEYDARIKCKIELVKALRKIGISEYYSILRHSYKTYTYDFDLEKEFITKGKLIKRSDLIFKYSNLYIRILFNDSFNGRDIVFYFGDSPQKLLEPEYLLSSSLDPDLKKIIIFNLDLLKG